GCWIRTRARPRRATMRRSLSWSTELLCGGPMGGMRITTPWMSSTRSWSKIPVCAICSYSRRVRSRGWAWKTSGACICMILAFPRPRRRCGVEQLGLAQRHAPVARDDDVVDARDAEDRGGGDDRAREEHVLPARAWVARRVVVHE